MSDNANSNNLTELPNFSGLEAYEQHIITEKSNGKTGKQIARSLKKQFGVSYKPDSITEMLRAGGRLFQAKLEYNERIANMALQDAQLVAKQLTIEMLDILKEIAKDPLAKSAARVAAAKTIKNTYLPEKQVVIGLDDPTANIPDEILNAGETILKQLNANVSDPPTGEPTSNDIG